jgi:uncharacterized membrane protein YbaN (DUF454 family)
MAASVLFFKPVSDSINGSRIYLIIGLLLGVLFFNGITFSFLTNQVYAVIFALFIFFMASSNYGTVLLNNRLLRWGGTVGSKS